MSYVLLFRLEVTSVSVSLCVDFGSSWLQATSVPTLSDGRFTSTEIRVVSGTPP